MPEQSIDAQDMNLKTLLQAFYRVPDYQREYVWGEPDPKSEREDEVELFLKDIHNEFELVTSDSAPEYFIGTVVVCPQDNDLFDLIDGQQRSTTIFLVLCAIRDLLHEAGHELPNDLTNQISASSTDWKGATVHRLRLELQYPDAGNVIKLIAQRSNAGEGQETRSIRNITSAYATIRQFLDARYRDDLEGLRRFYGYFTNKVKLIRIQTPNINKALKIFETINDRGVGLDAMDLLKNLLFMRANAADFSELKATWKTLTDEIYAAKERPLRFLRYYLMANFDIDARLREDDIYDWLRNNDKQAKYSANPLAFAARIRDAARDYRRFTEGKNPSGHRDHGIGNTKLLGGRAIRQHFILLLAARNLSRPQFERLSAELENLMFVWLITNTPTKDYERTIIDGVRQLRTVKSEADFDAFCTDFFERHKTSHGKVFEDALLRLRSSDIRAYRMRYLLAKVTQYIDIEAYGASGARTDLTHYTDGGNDIEHIFPQTPTPEAIHEFGQISDEAVAGRLGNLMLIESSINRSIQNDAYSVKREAYPSSQFLLARCQAALQQVGVDDKITRAMRKLKVYPNWNMNSVEERQQWLAALAKEVWRVRA